MDATYRTDVSNSKPPTVSGQRPERLGWGVLDWRRLGFTGYDQQRGKAVGTAGVILNREGSYTGHGAVD